MTPNDICLMATRSAGISVAKDVVTQLHAVWLHHLLTAILVPITVIKLGLYLFKFVATQLQ